MKKKSKLHEEKKWEDIIANKIVNELENRGLSILEFSRTIDVNPNTIYRITWGNYNPSLLTLAKICNGLNIPMSSLFDE